MRTISSSDDPKDKKAFLDSIAVASEEEGAKKCLFELRDGAKAVLLEAGYPKKEYGYGFNDDGTWFELKEPADRLGIERTGAWSFSPDMEPLSAEEFACHLIFRIDCLLKAVESGEDSWAIVYKALSILKPYYMHRAEVSGVASLAFSQLQGERPFRERSAGRNQLVRHVEKVRRKHSVRRAQQLWMQEPELAGNASGTAEKIREPVEQDVRFELGDSVIDNLYVAPNRNGFAKRTISRDLANFAREHRTKKTDYSLPN